jgi:branched-chain amino acid aminotransferase
VFLVRDGELLTPLPDACLPGITRAFVLELARRHGISASERRLTLADAYACAEMFTTGTMGELAHVVELDGRKIGDGSPGPLTRRLQEHFRTATQQLGSPIPT